MATIRQPPVLHKVTITFGKTLTDTVGRRHDVEEEELCLGDVLAEAIEGYTGLWWSPHVWKGDRRGQENWEAASAVAIDLDYYGTFSPRREHSPPPVEVAARLEGAKLPGNIFHQTPRGARVVFIFAKPVTDPQVFEGAARGAGWLVERALDEAGLLGRVSGRPLVVERSGYVVDQGVLYDRGRLLYGPCSLVPGEGGRRNAPVLLLGDVDPFTPEMLCEMPLEGLDAKESRKANSQAVAGGYGVNPFPLGELPPLGVGSQQSNSGKGVTPPIPGPADRLTAALLKTRKARLSTDGRKLSLCCPIHHDTTPSAVIYLPEFNLSCSFCGSQGRLRKWIATPEGRALLGDPLVDEVLGLKGLDSFLENSTPGGSKAKESQTIPPGAWKTAEEFAAETPTHPPILARYLIKGCLTELDGKVKAAGKTTFVLAMVKAIIEGKPFLDHSTVKSPVVYLNESPGAAFRQALDRAGLLNSKDLHVLNWHGVGGVGWEETVKCAVVKAQAVSAQVLVVDTFGQWTGIRGDSENDAGRMLEAVKPLQLALGHELGIWFTRHSKKGEAALGESGRGSSALSGAVDIIVDIRRLEGQGPRNRRLLSYMGRFSNFPDELVVELDVNGRYQVLGDQADTSRNDINDAILDALRQCPDDTGFDTQQLVDALKATGHPTNYFAVRTALKPLVASGEVVQLGTGKRGDPYRYRLRYDGDPPAAGSAPPGTPPETQPTPFEVLGVLPGASPEEIQKAYHEAAHEFHPDKNPGDPAAVERMKQVNAAHDQLSKPSSGADLRSIWSDIWRK